MPLQIYGQGKTGEIFIEDERPDGSVVLLVCTEAVTRAVGANGVMQSETHDESVGVAASSTTDGSVFPLFREQGVARKRFKLHVDTTNMPGGILKFAIAPFTRASLRAADEGEREIRLDTTNADEWGFLGTFPTDQPAPDSAENQPAQSTRTTRSTRSSAGGSAIPSSPTT
jgi:hypothetical protein